MNRIVQVFIERFPIAGRFTIARGSRTEAVVVRVAIAINGHVGQGECVPYARYGETVDGVVATIESMRRAIETGVSSAALQRIMPPGAARNAVDCALLDLEATQTAKPVWQSLGLVAPRDCVTCYTISVDTPEAMALAATKAKERPLLKIKLAGPGDAERLAAVREAAPDASLVVDANEAWTDALMPSLIEAAQRAGVKLIEQPLPAKADAALKGFKSPVPLCADESVHDRASLDELIGKYQAVNIKLDKTGGLTEASMMLTAARARGFGIMAGCMVGTSLAMAPAMLIAATADFVDLDGPLLLARDREPGLVYKGSVISPPESALWG
jgi:L-Ala-D/L-Glu epimerase